MQSNRKLQAYNNIEIKTSKTLSVLHVNRGQGHLEVMDDSDDEETQRGQRPWLPPSRAADRRRGLLAASQWSPDSTEVVGRTTLADTVPMGYGRPRGDATTCHIWMNL